MVYILNPNYHLSVMSPLRTVVATCNVTQAVQQKLPRISRTEDDCITSRHRLWYQVSAL